MTVTGETNPQAIYLQTAAGAALIYATKAAFLAAGWNLTWYDASNTALASQPTWSLSAGDSEGRHVVTYAVPDGPCTVKVTLPNSFYLAAPKEFQCEGQTYDEDALAGLFLASAGIVTGSVTTTGDELVLIDGNSIRVDLTVLDVALTYIGATSLANCDTLVAEIKKTATDSSSAAEVTTLVEAIVTDTVGARVVRCTLDAFPAALAVPTGGDGQAVTGRLDLVLTKGTKKVTAATKPVRVVWKAST
jgi:hypothetical protein